MQRPGYFGDLGDTWFGDLSGRKKKYNPGNLRKLQRKCAKRGGTWRTHPTYGGRCVTATPHQPVTFLPGSNKSRRRKPARPQGPIHIGYKSHQG